MRRRNRIPPRWVTLAGCFAMAAAWGCATTSDTVPVQGTEGELEFLVGTWTGEYTGDESERSGTLTFELQAGADTAHGHVLMDPARDVGYARGPAEDRPFVRAGAAPVAIGIRFVRLRGGLLEGRLAPYEDPVCGCPLATTFSGRLEGDVIRGTFETVHSRDGRRETGRWHVRKTS